MAHAELCPVCCGSGKIDYSHGGYSGILEKICHGCDGRGWVEVRDEREDSDVKILPSYRIWDLFSPPGDLNKP